MRRPDVVRTEGNPPPADGAWLHGKRRIGISLPGPSQAARGEGAET